jgi:uncharacterized protein (TIGR03067 family)
MTARVLVAFALTATFVGCKKPEEIAAEKATLEAEQAKLQGTWKIASREGEEDPESEVSGKGAEFVIEGDILKRMFNGEVESRQKITLYPKTDPKQIDLLYVKADGSPETYQIKKKGKGKKKDKIETKTIKQKGIYSVEGDKLKLCLSWDDKNRPTEFTTGPGLGRNLLILQKIGASSKDDKEKKEEKKDDKKEKKDDKGEKKDDKPRE